MAAEREASRVEPLRARRSRPPRSLRALALMSLAGAVLLVACVAALLVASTAALGASVRALANDGRSLESSEHAEGELLRYVRLANQRAVMREPANPSMTAEVREQLHEELRTTTRLADTAAERAKIDDLWRQIERYIDARESMQAEHVSLPHILTATHAQLDGILATFRDLTRVYDRELRDSEARAANVATVSYASAGVAIALVLAGVLVAAVAFRNQFVRPLRGIVAAIDRLRLGEAPASAPSDGPEELRRIASLLNEATDALAAQKKRELAFLAGVAHDLKNPLSALKMAVATLRESVPAVELDEDATRTLALVERQIGRLASMVGDLVDATRIEAGELELTLVEHDLRQSAREIAALYAPVSPTHSIVLELPEHPVVVHADALRIEQVVSNLVSNAIKYSPSGGEVRVCVEEDGDEALLSVSDRGVGIPRDQLEVIFLPFRRGLGARGVAAGAGLGLSVLRRIVDAHAGRIEVESKPGVGSTFLVYLPLARRSERAEARAR